MTEVEVHRRSGESAIAKLGSIEDRLVKCVGSGEILDLTSVDESASPASMEEWGKIEPYGLVWSATFFAASWPRCQIH